MLNYRVSGSPQPDTLPKVATRRMEMKSEEFEETAHSNLERKENELKEYARLEDVFANILIRYFNNKPEKLSHKDRAKLAIFLDYFLGVTDYLRKNNRFLRPVFNQEDVEGISNIVNYEFQTATAELRDALASIRNRMGLKDLTQPYTHRESKSCC